MISTDGRPTIASYGTPIAPVVSGDVALLEDIQALVERPLLERDASGLLVEIVLIGDGPIVRITEARGTVDERELVGIVAPDKVLDAFEHPYLYV